MKPKTANNIFFDAQTDRQTLGLIEVPSRNFKKVYAYLPHYLMSKVLQCLHDIWVLARNNLRAFNNAKTPSLIFY